ncbi:hypothetical protein BKA63DRAFT_572168 [Paraphoma chrysanthemicola]|nr:hypothetical protein BKA63DRAFT_572168 [Paraphoma chrysanthemicola]
MKCTTAAFLALFATSVLAAPAARLTSSKRDTLGVYLCTDRDWQGYCAHLQSEPSECVNLGADLNDLISSAGPDQGGFCYFFVDPNCSIAADFFHVGFPGIADLSVTPVNGPVGSTRSYEDKLSSYFCVYE